LGESTKISLYTLPEANTYETGIREFQRHSLESKTMMWFSARLTQVILMQAGTSHLCTGGCLQP